MQSDWTFYAATVRREGNDSRIRLYRGDGANLGMPGMSTVQQVGGDLVVPAVVFTNPNPSANWQIVGENNGFGPVPSAQDTNGSPYQGRIDDVRAFDRALVEVEINALFNEANNASLPGN